MKLTFALWTRTAVLLLVQQEFGIELPIRTMDETFNRDKLIEFLAALIQDADKLRVHHS